MLDAPKTQYIDLFWCGLLNILSHAIGSAFPANILHTTFNNLTNTCKCRSNKYINNFCVDELANNMPILSYYKQLFLFHPANLDNHIYFPEERACCVSPLLAVTTIPATENMLRILKCTLTNNTDRMIYASLIDSHLQEKAHFVAQAASHQT